MNILRRIVVKSLSAVQVKLIQIAVIGVGVVIGKKLVDKFDNKLPVKLRKPNNKQKNVINSNIVTRYVKEVKHVKDHYELVSISVPTQPNPWGKKYSGATSSSHRKVAINSMYGKMTK